MQFYIFLYISVAIIAMYYRYINNVLLASYSYSVHVYSPEIEAISFLNAFFLEMVVSLASLYISKQVSANAKPLIVTYKLTICHNIIKSTSLLMLLAAKQKYH